MNTKQLIISIALIVMSSISAHVMAQTMMRPPSLKPGDKVAIISPASNPEESWTYGGAEVLRSWGLEPVFGENVLKQNGTFAGSIEQRLADLEWAFTADSIKAIMCSRGGYGSIQELLRADVTMFSKHPKWLIGYSDITAVHSCINRQGVMSIHAHMLEHLNRSMGEDECDAYLRDILFGKMPTYHLPSNVYNRHGIAEGRLVGGNLSLLTSVIGSPFDMLHPCDSVPLVLFLEDVDENLQHLNRMAYQLIASGVMEQVKGVILGDFSGYKPTPDFDTVEDMFRSIFRDYNIPISYLFPCGHTRRNFPMVEGATVRLTVDGNGTTLQFLDNSQNNE
ncbi:MAG: LD-carboxypeptidase [Muribaculaceae bacterium]